MTRVLRGILILIALLTALSGAAQIVAPAFVLRLVGGPASPASHHFFGIIGLFMLLFGGLAFQALRGPEAAQPLPLRWAGLQKLGAFVAVAMGVLHGLFAPMAWLVAGFDLLTGILFFVYLVLLRREVRP